MDLSLSRLGLLSFAGVIVFTLGIPVAAQPASNGDWETTLRTDLSKMADHLTATLKPWPVPSTTFPVENYGAVADGSTINTGAIQKAIDACSAAGGGAVVLAKGDYVSGTIELKSGVMLEVDKAARLLASTSLSDFPDHNARHPTIMDTYYKMKMSLIYAENCERIGIRGDGEIDGRGQKHNFPGPGTIGPMPGRPFLLRFIECRKVVMSGIHLKSSPAWMENYVACDDVILDGIHVENLANVNNDGIDMDGGHNVIIRNCQVASEDDGMCFKGASGRTMGNVLVENSKFYSTCNALKFGTDTQGNFRNALIRNCEVGGPDGSRGKTRPAISGISWESVDGADVENIVCSNINIVRVRAPIFLRLGKRDRVMAGQTAPEGALHHLVFDTITGSDCGKVGSIFSGVPGTLVQDVVLRHVHLTVNGGGKPQKVPGEKVPLYPESLMFGPEGPAYGFWLRHAQNIAFYDIVVTPQQPDQRPFIGLGPNTSNISLDGHALLGDYTASTP